MLNNSKRNIRKRVFLTIMSVKRVISAFLVVLMLFGTLSFSSCQLFCDHSYELISNTAKCEEGGIKTYRCKKCDYEKRDKSEPIGHDYQLLSDTAKCEEDGIKTYYCKNCNNKKTEASNAKGHNYAHDFCCTRCCQPRYNIKVTIKPNSNNIEGIEFWPSDGNFCVFLIPIVKLKYLQYSYVLKNGKGKTLKKGSGVFYYNYSNNYWDSFCVLIDYKMASFNINEKYTLTITIN